MNGGHVEEEHLGIDLQRIGEAIGYPLVADGHERHELIWDLG